MLSHSERKARLPYGACARVAERLAVSDTMVSHVMVGRQRHAKIERALVKLMQPPTTVVEAFGPEPRILRRAVRKEAA